VITILKITKFYICVFEPYLCRLVFFFTVMIFNHIYNNLFFEIPYTEIPSANILAKSNICPVYFCLWKCVSFW